MGGRKVGKARYAIILVIVQLLQSWTDLAMRNRSSNNPKRRVVPAELVSSADVERLEKTACYVGSGHHKRNPADYGFARTNPRPTKSICDMTGRVLLSSARALMLAGIKRKMMSAILEDGFPKFIWSVADDGSVYESKTHPNTSGQYHGYPLEIDDDMHAYILGEWKKR